MAGCGSRVADGAARVVQLVRNVLFELLAEQIDATSRQLVVQEREEKIECYFDFGREHSSWFRDPQMIAMCDLFTCLIVCL